MEILIQQYGPIAFGVVALLVIWKTIVAPQLKQNKIESDTILATARINHDTARMLDSLASTLNASIKEAARLADKLEQANK